MIANASHGVAVALHAALHPPSGASPTKGRAAEFRPRVLRAYDHACAFCGYDGMVCGSSTQLAPVALAAAQVQWHVLHGPDEVANGLALCDLHHTLFDRGLLGIDGDRRVVVSPAFSGRSEAAQRVDARDIDWHRAQVFRAGAA